MAPITAATGPSTVAMANLTCVVDAPTLVDKINEIKQWVYSDTIRIYVPLHTSESVEQRYKASLTPNEVQKEQPPKRHTKLARREYPLFDINPRIAGEFLLRARSEQDSYGVLFQAPGEEFSQWKEGREPPIQVEKAPEAAPSSFQAALLRKLNINDGVDVKDSKGSLKPKLVARSMSPKSPWKHHKIPTVAAAGVPADLKPLLSSVLWRLHEYENNPLFPENCVLLTDDDNVSLVAQKLGIPLKRSQDIRNWVLEKQASEDNRATAGELEVEFPINANRTPAAGNSQPKGGATFTSDFGFEALLAEEEDELSDLKNSVASRALQNGQVKNAAPASAALETPSLPHSQPQTVTGPIAEQVNVAAATAIYRIESPDPAQQKAQVKSKISIDSKCEDTSSSISSASRDETDHIPTRVHEKNVGSNGDKKTNLKAELEKDSSDDDSDDDVIVFDPKSRRFSGQPKNAASFAQPKITPTNENIQPKQPETLAKPRMVSALRPQSPIFTPAQSVPVVQPEMQSLGAAIESIKPSPTSPSNDLAHKQPQPGAPRQPRTTNPTKHPNHDFAQRQGRDILQRQREAIQRKVQAVAAPPPAPRKIQIEPTAHPTVIDPDAFDRSYVVQPPSKPKEKSGHQGIGNPHKRSHNIQSNRRPSPPGSPPRGHKSVEPDFDFVLKSGSPRASTRGKGKLWVP